MSRQVLELRNRDGQGEPKLFQRGDRLRTAGDHRGADDGCLDGLRAGAESGEYRPLSLVPAPVKRMTISKCPARRRLPNSRTAVLSERGISRKAGAT
mgnify:CR=1 FL=1